MGTRYYGNKIDWFNSPGEQPIERPPCVRTPGQLHTHKSKVVEPECGFCERPKCPILCSVPGCNFKHAKLRVQRLCPNAEHHRIKLLSDWGKCPDCGSVGSLIEIHSGPYQVLFGNELKSMLVEDGKETKKLEQVPEATNASPAPTGPSSSRSLSSTPTPTSLPHSPLEIQIKTIAIDRPKVVMKCNVDEVDALVTNMIGLGLAEADDEKKNPVEDSTCPSLCICKRSTKCVFCSACGFYLPKGRSKRMCFVHKICVGGLAECPECGMTAEFLNEIY